MNKGDIGETYVYEKSTFGYFGRASFLVFDLREVLWDKIRVSFEVEI